MMGAAKAAGGFALAGILQAGCVVTCECKVLCVAVLAFTDDSTCNGDSTFTDDSTCNDDST